MEMDDRSTRILLEALKFFQEDAEQISKQGKFIMAAIDNLNTNVAALAADVKSLLAVPAGVPEAEVQAAADAVAAIDAQVKAVQAVVVPPPPSA
jgi:hypothetical protein